MNAMRLTFRKGDLLAIALVAVLAVGVLLAFLPKAEESSATVQVYQDGALLRELPLNKDETFEIRGEYVNTVQIKDGKVSVIHTDCPGGDCAHTGAVHTPGRSIVCLPNRVELRIVGTADVDFVVG